KAGASCKGPVPSSSGGTASAFLGWDSFRGGDGVTRDFYLRQLWDSKASVDVDTTAPEALRIGAQICGWTPAVPAAGGAGPHRRLPGRLCPNRELTERRGHRSHAPAQ